MKTIGLIGGMSWESTKEYYSIINKEVNKKLGKLHSAKIILHSLDFEEIMTFEWKECTKILIDAAKKLEIAGASCIVICANTMHKIAEDVQKNVKIPVLHIADATAEKIKEQKIKNIGLIGTKYTMEEDFYKDRLIKKYGLNVIIPDEKEREIINKIIHGELCLGKINSASKKKFIEIINKLASKGAEGIVLGCTEIPLLIKQKDSKIPLFDTAEIHAKYAVEFALKK